MPKRKIQREEIIGKNEPINKKSLSEITSVTSDLLEIMNVDKESQTETKEIFEKDVFIDETNHYLLLDKITDNLELNEIINESFEGDAIDGFKEKIKELVENMINEIKGNIDSSGGENSNKKSGLLKQ